MSDSNKALVCAIVHYLKRQINSGGLDEDGTEGLGIGIQCLETAYNIDETSLTENTYDLEEIFHKYLKKQEDNNDDINRQKTEAEILKNEGNRYMDSYNFREAIACYTRAIGLDTRNAVYYSNRAAALNNFGEHDIAIEDCRTALNINPLYHKAYARMGVAYKAKNQLKEARDSFKKALQLQPDNENYKMQLKNAEDALRNSERAQSVNIDGTRFHLGNENDLGNIIDVVRSMFFNRHSS